MAQLRIGISGWNYDSWRGAFYPAELPKRRELEYATRVFNGIEINGTFYSLKSPRSFGEWHDVAPDGFVYAVKGSRYITHVRRLRDVETALANFFASGVLKLAEKLGPVLWQLPPNMAYEPEHFEAFCELLPGDTREAARLARRHNAQVKQTWFQVKQNHRLRHAFEIRDPRMMNEELIRVLRRHGHALAIADTGRRYPFAEDITAGFVYVRLHGPRELYASDYGEKELDWWKRRIRRWAVGDEMKTATRISQRPPPRRKSRDVYVYFDNDVRARAPHNALRLAEKLGVANDVDALAGIDGERLPPPAKRG